MGLLRLILTNPESFQNYNRGCTLRFLLGKTEGRELVSLKFTTCTKKIRNPRFEIRNKLECQKDGNDRKREGKRSFRDNCVAKLSLGTRGNGGSASPKTMLREIASKLMAQNLIAPRL